MNMCTMETGITFLFIFLSSLSVLHATLFPNAGELPFKGPPLKPCHVCRILVKSFLKAVEETSRGNFEGGDALWEEQKLGHYSDSELRFIEIQEKLCSDTTKGKDQCHILAEMLEEKLENWFYKERKNGIELLKFLCVDYLKICCPDNTYGPSCKPCPGDASNPCSGHGKCKGEGTRDGTGECMCDAGYTGKLCDQCEKGYYLDTNNSLVTCKICDISCKGHCRGPGPQACEVCAFGFRHDPDKGCVGHFDDYTSLDDTNETDANETEDKHNDTSITFSSVDANSAQHTEL